MFKLSKKDPTDYNIQAYKKFRNTVLSRQRQAERKHFKEQYDQSLNEQNYKKAWDITRLLIDGKSNFSKNKITEYTVNNKKMTDPVAIANSFNDYFINVGNHLPIILYHRLAHYRILIKVKIVYRIFLLQLMM